MNIFNGINATLPKINGAEELLQMGKSDLKSTNGAGDFGALVNQMFMKLEGSVEQSKEAIEQYAQNQDAVSLERLSLLMAKAETEIKVATQLRNRMVNAYQDIINMQV